MTNIINFCEKRKKKKDIPSIIDEINSNLLDEWNKKQQGNKLLQFFIPFIDTKSKNPLLDLSTIQQIESDIGLNFILYAPGMFKPEMIGFTVQFKILDEIVTTPDMNTENLARCYAVILYKKLQINL